MVFSLFFRALGLSYSSGSFGVNHRIRFMRTLVFFFPLADLYSFYVISARLGLMSLISVHFAAYRVFSVYKLVSCVPGFLLIR